jgi:NTE family protein
VGVIKVLEEYRVPIDCVAGTSMGALVGGAYASGMSVPEMEQDTSDITEQKLFKERPPREELAMRRKADDFRNYIGPEIGTGADAAVLTRGVVSGVQLETVLRKLSRVHGHVRFDELPIPFRAVATDLVTGKPVVFSEGELANVMRASMSVPGAVAPAEYGGMTLVDGMLTSNLPVDAARAMGADVVIAVNVGTPLLKREQLTSIFGVANQMLSILTEQNVQASIASLKPTDILISPELGDYSTGDFDNLTKITPLGEEAARKVADALARLSLQPAEYASLRQRQQKVPPPDLKPIDEIRFAALKHVNPEVAQAVMQTQPNEPLQPSELDADMRRLHGTGDFEHVNYRILEEPGKRILVVDAVEKAWGPNYLRLGLGLSSDVGTAARFNVIANHRMTWLNSLGAELRTDVQLGFNNRLRLELYQPFDVRGRYFIAPRVDLRREEVDIYRGSDRIATYELGTRTAGLDLGVQFGPYAELRVGVEGGSVRPKVDTGIALIGERDQRYRQGGIRSYLVLDQMDSASFPRAGWGAQLDVYNSLSDLGAADAYTKWRLSGGGAYSLGDNTLRLNLTAGGRIGSDALPPYDLFQWGGFLRQSGYATGQLVGGSLEFGQLVYFRRIVRGGLLDGAYGGLSPELGRYGTPLVPGNTSGTLKSISLFVAVDSPVGPVYLGYGQAADGSGALYFYLGLPL